MRTMRVFAALAALTLLAGGLRAEIVAWHYGVSADAWHGRARVEAVPGGVALDFAKAGDVAWNCWSRGLNWEKLEKCVIEVDSPADGVELGVAVSDDEEFYAGFAVTLKKGANEIALPLADLFRAGLQTKYVRGVALWALKGPCSVTLKGWTDALGPPDFSKLQRAGNRMLDDAERRNSCFFWYYSFEERKVKVTDERASSGTRSFLCDFAKPAPPRKPNVISSYGRFPHDWRGYASLDFEAFNPKDKAVTLTVEVKDTWIPMFSHAVLFSREVELPPGQWTTVTFPLTGLERTDAKGVAQKLNLEYVQQILLKVPDDARPMPLYVDNVRLTGKAGSAFVRPVAAADIPAFGFEESRDTLKLPGDLRRLALAGPADKLKVGAGKACVTPKVGTRMASGDFASEGVLDDIYVRVLFLQQPGRDIVAWLHIDNLYMPARPEMQAALAEKFGVKPENIFWSATHNHNSGAPWASKPFTEQIIAGFTKAAEDAFKSMKPVRLGIARTSARFNFNRILKGPDGNIYSTLDSKYMNYLEDSRPTDEELATLWFVGDDGAPVAGVLYYTGHANMLCRVMPWLSGDWPGWTERLLEAASGAVVMHVQGPLGDTDMRDICTSYDRTIRAGWDVAYSAMRATEKDLKPIDPSAMAGVGVRNGEAQGTAAKEGQPPQKLGVHVLTIGPVAFCDLGGEVWTRFGLELRAKSPYPCTFLNFSSGFYFPEEWAFEKKMYGSANRQPDWGPALRDKAAEMLKEAAGK